ncbi:xanthine dehydrogenase small subunit [Salinarimonas ramus]|uniref:Xanthine dehydrogenase small subunit n=1 Tax=Salinarimonas ramus TaxID=690164 RepID=A0A917QAL9_9HYPH|nr:xanthine dehydrogenase small subunit [Salinarimonas ramus]GGK36810.1 xanthine dehydrogenase small subunit [Salinarimonas ramus]
MRDAIRFTRNGTIREIRDAHPRATLLDWLRLEERATGTKEGCAEGDCGACTVALGRLIEGRVVYEPVNACIVLLGQCDGADVVSVEDIAADGALHPVQEAMVAHHGSQCGFCTPGIVMSLFTLYEEGARPVERATVNDALAGNLCRCTGYRPIVDAALDACAAPRDRRFEAHREATARALAEIAAAGEDLFVGDETRFFAAPASEESLCALLARHPDATILAGATDVGLWITKALMEIEKIVWLGRIEALRETHATPETLTLGAMVSHAAAHEALAAIDPDLGELMRRFGSAQVRASGTVGGNIANGSPIGDLPPALIALGATLHLAGAKGTRTLPLEDFFIAYRRQDREPGEYVRAVDIDKLRKHDVFRCYKVTKRFDEDISAVMGAFRLRLDGRRIASARVAFGGMAATPKRAPLTEAALVGLDLDDELAWAPALDALARDYRPMSDHRASSEYRALVARNLLFKALAEIAGAEGTRIAPRIGGLAAAE